MFILLNNLVLGMSIRVSVAFIRGGGGGDAVLRLISDPRRGPGSLATLPPGGRFLQTRAVAVRWQPEPESWVGILALLTQSRMTS